MGAVSAHADAPFLDLRSGDGARARIHLDGAQVASWIPAGSTDDRLFVSARALYGAGKSIRGGIPICFPQFGPYGALPQHGFARTSRWTLVREEQPDEPRPGKGARATLQLRETEQTRAVWPHAFRADLHVQVHGARLAVTLEVSNTGADALSFTAALHPYFRVRDAFATRVRGLGGTRFRDALRDGVLFDETNEPLPITGPLDRVYVDAPDVLEIVEPDRTLRIEKIGFPDAVVWNPGPAGTASRVDFAPGEEQHMLCVEAGAIMQPVVLAPGARWSGTQILTAVSGP